MSAISPYDKIVQLTDGYYYGCYTKCSPGEDCTVACGTNICDEEDTTCQKEVNKYTNPMFKLVGNNYDLFLNNIMGEKEHKVYKDNIAYITKDYVYNKLESNPDAFVKQLSFFDKTIDPKIDEMITYDTPKGECLNIYPCKEKVSDLGICCESKFSQRSPDTAIEGGFSDEMIIDNIRQGMMALKTIFDDEKLQKEIHKYTTAIDTYLEKNIKSPHDIKRVIDEYITNVLDKSVLNKQHIAHLENNKSHSNSGGDRYNTNDTVGNTDIINRNTYLTNNNDTVINDSMTSKNPIVNSGNTIQNPIVNNDTVINNSMTSKNPFVNSGNTIQNTIVNNDTVINNSMTSKNPIVNNGTLTNGNLPIVVAKQGINENYGLDSIIDDNIREIIRIGVVNLREIVQEKEMQKEITSYIKSIKAFIEQNNVTNPKDIKRFVDIYIKGVLQNEAEILQKEESPRNMTMKNYLIIFEVFFAIVLILFMVYKKK